MRNKIVIRKTWIIYCVKLNLLPCSSFILEAEERIPLDTIQTSSTVATVDPNSNNLSNLNFENLVGKIPKAILGEISLNLFPYVLYLGECLKNYFIKLSLKRMGVVYIKCL